MKKILVTNLYGGMNIGDMAIRNVALETIDRIVKNKKMYLLCESVDNFYIQNKNLKKWSISYAPYGYAIRSKKSPKSTITKFFRFIFIYLKSSLFILLGTVSSNFLPKNGFYKYILWIKESDIVIAMGGGYLITSNSITDYFGILLNLLPIFIAKIMQKKVIFLPMSFGPFSSNLQEKITGMAINGELFMSREEISTEIAGKYNSNVKQIPDLALMNWGVFSNHKRSNYFVLTFRESLQDKNMQIKFEKEVALFIEQVWKMYSLSCVFIPMAANPIEENDITVAKNIQSHLPNSSHYKIIKAKNPDEVKKILSKAKFAVCNRLHSAILSATVFTPFVTISYAHKTIGFLKMMDLGKWNIPMGEVDSKTLVDKVKILLDYGNYNQYIDNLKTKRVFILNNRYTFEKILTNNINSSNKSV